MKKLVTAALCLATLAGCASLSTPPTYYIAVAVRPDSQLPFQQSVVIHCPQVKEINIPEVGKAQFRCLGSSVQLSLQRGTVVETASGQKSWRYETVSTREQTPVPASDPESRSRQETERLMGQLTSVDGSPALKWAVFRHR